MPTSSCVLLIEKSARLRSSHEAALRGKGYEVAVEPGVKEVVAHKVYESADIAVLDAASMNTSGIRMSGKLKEVLNGVPLILLCPKNTAVPTSKVADAVLVEPFTSRKLHNRISRLLPPDPKDVISAGPIQLDTTMRTVICHGRKTYLTPKLANMLQHFLAHAGRLVRRETLMRFIWHTNYTGDMRTIDVHVSWLRKAIEKEPSSPHLLKTIRGIGYRLDLPER